MPERTFAEAEEHVVPTAILGCFVVPAEVFGKHHIHQAVRTFICAVRVVGNIMGNPSPCLKSSSGGAAESRSRGAVHAVDVGLRFQRSSNKVWTGKLNASECRQAKCCQVQLHGGQSVGSKF